MNLTPRQHRDITTTAQRFAAIMGGRFVLSGEDRYAVGMNHDPDADLIQRVVQAMREAARTNGADSPHTELEAMALAAIAELRAT